MTDLKGPALCLSGFRLLVGQNKQNGDITLGVAETEQHFSQFPKIVKT